MREREKACRANDSDIDRAGRKILNHALHEAAINKFLADRHGNDESKEGETLDMILRKKFLGELWDEALVCSRLTGKFFESDNLIQQNQSDETDGKRYRDGRPRNGKAELRGGYTMRRRTPQNNSRSNPLEGDSGSVQGEPVLLGRRGHLHQLTHAAAAEQRNGDAEKKENEGEIPIHRKRSEHF